jgi:MoxR-like ATPase
MQNAEAIGQKITENVEKVIVGKHDVVQLTVIALLCEGHLLIEDVPGTGKTMLAKSIAKSLGCSFRRIQFTPDMLPSDVTGVSVFNQKTREFEFRPGPVMAQIVLTDEINRATPKTQSALLEAMEERQITVDGVTYPMEQPFLVLATQNPIEYEGTFPLPEAQLDRFMLKLSVGYPSAADEKEILQRRRKRMQEEVALKNITSAATLLEIRQAIETVHVDEDLEGYIVALVDETRRDKRVAVGASPRASLAFLMMARAHAALHGRDFVLPDDIKHYALPVLSHRIILQPEHWMSRRISSDVIRDIFSKTPVPVIK